MMYHIEPREGTQIFPVDLILGSILASTIPLLIGILFAKKVTGRILFTGFIIGSLFFLFFDLLKQTSGLSEARINNIIDITNYIGIFLPLIISKGESPNIYIAYTWALLGVGFHSFGEGTIIAYDFLTGETLISLTQVISFSLHKFAEGFAIGILLYEISKEIKDTLVCFLLATIPFILGLTSAFYYPTAELATVFFAIASGSTVFLLAYFLAKTRINERLILGIIFGLSFIFFAGVLHSI
jgi:zinc transporter ZupT